MNKRLDRFVIWMSVPLAALFATTALAGVFWPPTYAQEKIKWALQGMAGDAVNLFVIVPVLLVTAILAYRGSIPAKLIWLGTLLCILYSSIFYALAVHFNKLFFVYCGVVGLQLLCNRWKFKLCTSQRDRCQVRPACSRENDGHRASALRAAHLRAVDGANHSGVAVRKAAARGGGNRSIHTSGCRSGSVHVPSRAGDLCGHASTQEGARVRPCTSIDIRYVADELWHRSHGN